MIDRFLNRNIIKNDFSMYREYLNNRDKKYLLHYNTPKFNFPTTEELNYIRFVEHIWTQGDRLYKLSEKYCGDQHHWWIILKFNKIGSEFNIKLGDLIKIPIDIEEIIKIFL